MILDIDKYCNETIIDKIYIPEITSSSMKQSNGQYDPKGLFSTEYFGMENSMRWKNMFAKIVLPHPVIHPAIFYIINRRVSYLLKWINLEIGFIRDEDDSFILSNQINRYDYCGLMDLYSNSELICDALLRTGKFDTITAKTILKRIVDRSIPIFTSNVIVMPPAFRPQSQTIGSSDQDDNKFYVKILEEINILKSAMQSRDKILTNRVLSNIQNLYNYLFEAMINKIKGKTGLIRGALLGKNADFSGRAVIVGDPLIRPSQLGVPRTMLIRLFYPWIIHYIMNNKNVISELTKLGISVNIPRLFNLINTDLFEKSIDDRIMQVLSKCMEEVIKDKVILAKRDPVLHKLSVRGFYPVPVEDSSIHISPLVCTKFNADFDGDQMAIFVPLSQKAQDIVKNEMLSTKNLYAPDSGLSFTVEKDYILGIYYMTKDAAPKDIKPKIIPDSTSIKDFMNMVYKAESFNTPVTYFKRTNTLGRRAVELIFKDIIKVEEALDDKKVEKLLNEIVKKKPEELENILYSIMRISAVVSSFIGGTMSVKDFNMPDDLKKRRDEIIAHPDKYDVSEELKNITKEFMNRSNSDDQLPVMLVNSGARGSVTNIQQISVAKGYISDATGKTLADPIGSNFSDGFKPVDYFTSSFGNRKGVVDRSLNTASSGYLQRQMIYLVAPVKSGDTKNCGTNKFMELVLTDEYLDVLKDRVLSNGEVLTKEYAERHDLFGKKIKIYSPMYCKEHKLCKHCYPDAYRKRIDYTENVGLVSANIIGERGSQLIMKQFHCLCAQSLVYLKQNEEYSLNTLYDLFDKRRDNIIYTLNSTQQEIDISNENIYVDNNGKWTKALKIIRHKRNPDSPMVFIKSNSGYTFSSQDNHRMIIDRDNNIEYIEPKNIIVNKDKMLISLINIWQENKKDCFINPYLLGCILGDGCAPMHKQTRGKDNKRPDCIKIAAQEGEYNNKIRNKLINIIKNTIKEPKINKTGIQIYDVKLACEYVNKCGHYSQTKRLPPEFIYYNDETLAKILCGMIDTDGCIKWKNKENKEINFIRICINNEGLITELSYILSKFNIYWAKSIATIKENYLFKNNGRRSKLNYQMYELRLYPTNQDLQTYFKESIKCENCIVKINRREKNKIKNNTITFIKPILFKDDLDEFSYVYDLETEDHQYSANMINIKNTGGASSILYLSKEAPQLQGIISQENNTLIAMKDIVIRVIDYISDTIDIYSSKDFQVILPDTRETIDVEFSGLINFSGLMARNVKQSNEDMILTFEAGDTVGEIDAEATDTTNAVKTIQRVLNKSNQFENGTELVLELYNIFKNSAKIQLLHFEILVSQLMRDPDKIYYPYRYGSMTKEPKMIGIKSVPGIESPRRGLMFERILDVVTNSVLQSDSGKDERIQSDLEQLFEI